MARCDYLPCQRNESIHGCFNFQHNSPQVNFSEFHNVVKKQMGKMDEWQARSLFSRLDASNAGVVTLEDFENWWMRTSDVEQVTVAALIRRWNTLCVLRLPSATCLSNILRVSTTAVSLCQGTHDGGGNSNSRSDHIAKSQAIGRLCQEL